MKKGPIIIIVLAVIAFIAVFIFYFGNKEKKYNWFKTYQKRSKEPYGLAFFNETFEGSHDDSSLVTINSSLTKVLTKDAEGVYVAVSGYLYYGYDELDSLLAFVERGNQAFLCSGRPPYELQEKLFVENQDSLFYPLAVDTFFIDLQLKNQDSSFQISYAIRDSSYLNTWYCFDKTFYNDSLFYAELGHFAPGHNTNFLKVKYGKGEFLLHSTPLAFTNYYVAKESGLQYVNDVLNELDDGTIYFDLSTQSNYSQNSYSSGNNVSEGPLGYLLSHQSMRWAWYLMLFLVIVYMTFNLKRKQRVIPIADSNENTSLAFVQSIGSLYFHSRNHKKIALKEMELFLFHVRKKYSINTTHLNEEFVSLLAAKSEVREQLIEQILEKHKAIDYLSEFSDEMLINFHQLLEEFYNTSK